IHHGAGLVDHALAQGGSTGGGGILSVGTHYDHKEGRSLIQAYAHLRDRWPDAPSLTIVGRDHRHNRAALEGLCRELRIQDRVRVLGFVDDNALRALWSQADLAVLLSQQEGFGLPAAEAMSAGVPLVVSRRGALPEVAEGASVRVDPSNPSAVAEAMHRVLADLRLHAELVQAGRQRADQFTWSRCAASLLETLDLASRESR
ncbi:MAG: glycosyltransferase, partial [Bacteroidota bacterium]